MAHALQKSALDVLRCGQGSSNVRAPSSGGGRAATGSNAVGVQLRAPAGGFGKRAWSGVSLVRRSAVVRGGGGAAENGARGGAVAVTSVLAERGESSSSSSSLSAVVKEAEEPKKLEKEAVVMKSAAEGGFDVDPRVEEALKTQGFRSLRRTKLVATIGPACCSFEQLEALAASGMTVARLNMCHGTHDWHRQAIRNCRRLNSEKGYSIVVMIDTEGSEIHMGDLGGAASAKAEDGDEWYFTVRKFDGPVPAYTLLVNYEGFAEDVKVGDELVVDGGMVRFEVVEKVGPDVKCKCIDPGLLLPCANLTFWRNGHIVQEKNVMLPTISSKDWVDIDFAISEGVDAIAVSFVKSPEVIKHLKSYVAARSPERGVAVFAKIEAAESLKCLDDIIRVSDGAMVARGDLGAQIPLEQVPSVQEAIVAACRRLNKPVIVASQLLESMIEYPTPTRAEVADVSEAVRQQADALMLSGESAMGLFPQKAMEVLRVVSLRMEDWCREEGQKETVPFDEISSSTTGRISEQICNSAAQMASKLGADAIFVYTRRGYMASLLSRNRPDCPIFAFTEEQSVRLRMDLKWGVIPFRMDFGEDLESNLQRTFALLKARGMVQSGNLVVAVSDVLSPLQSGEILQSIQVRKIP